MSTLLGSQCTECECVLLSPDAPENFRYTNQGGEMLIPGTDDLSDLERTRNAFTILGRMFTSNHARTIYL